MVANLFSHSYHPHADHHEAHDYVDHHVDPYHGHHDLDQDHCGRDLCPYHPFLDRDHLAYLHVLYLNCLAIRHGREIFHRDREGKGILDLSVHRDYLDHPKITRKQNQKKECTYNVGKVLV